MKLAEHPRATRQIEIQNHQFGFLSGEKRKGSFLDYFKAVAAKKVGSNSDNWYMGLRYFGDYAGPDLRFIDLNVAFCEEYRAYLLSGLALGQRQKRISVNTAVSYFDKFKAVLKAAYKAGSLSQNLNDLVEPIKDEETHGEFLTIDEFQKLAVTEVKNALLKSAASFSSLTGLRFSDVYRCSRHRNLSCDCGRIFAGILKISGAYG